jgi:hypothetical protein
MHQLDVRKIALCNELVIETSDLPGCKESRLLWIAVGTGFFSKVIYVG